MDVFLQLIQERLCSSWPTPTTVALVALLSVVVSTSWYTFSKSSISWKEASNRG